MKRIASFIAVFLALAWPGASRLRAYAFEYVGSGANQGEIQQWPAGTAGTPTRVQMTLQLQESPAPAISGTLQDGSTSWNEVAMAAISDWNQYLSTLKLGSVISNNPAPTSKSAQNNNNVFWSNTIYGDAWGSVGAEAVGITIIWTETTTTPQNVSTTNVTETDVLFNANATWNSYSGGLQSSTDFRRVALHEFGHVLGLNHPDQAGQTVSAIMNSVTSATDDLTTDDKAGGEYLYGAPGLVQIVTQPAATSVQAGHTATFSTVVTGLGPITYQWQLSTDGGSTYGNVGGATSSTLVVANVQSPGSQQTYYRVIITNGSGSVTSNAVALTVEGAPAFTQAASPSSVTIDPGRSVVFNATATGTPAPAYQWTLNGSTSIPGAASTTDPVLLVSGATASNSGTYTCTATNAVGNATTSATLAVQATGSPARLVNLSARAEDLGGGNILIAGLSVGGAGAEPVLIRGVGPTLSGTLFSISNYLPNPVITLFDNHSKPIVSDQGWGNAFVPGSSTVNVSPAAATISLMNQVGAFVIPQASLDSAMEIQIQAPGNYTMELTDANGATGVGLAEVYDAGNTSSPTRLTNISARADVGAGGDILIGGLVVTGVSGETVLLRAVGPGLVNQGLSANSGLLAQPSLAVYQGSTQIYSNTGWGGDPVISSVFSSVGATALESADSAVLLTLPNGAYTVLVSGAGGSSGIGLVEVFEVY